MLSPDRMRRIDYWVGVPLCFVLTGVARALDVLGRQRPPSSPKHVLFIELAEMGSLVLAVPAVRRLKVQSPDCRTFFLVFRHVSPGVRVLDLAGNSDVMTIDPSSLRTVVRDTLRFLRNARRHRIDTVINLESFARFSTILAFLTGARTRVGFAPFAQRGLYVGDLVTHRVIYNPHIHTWQSFVTLVQALEQPENDLPLGKVPIPLPHEGVLPDDYISRPASESFKKRFTADYPVAAGKRLIVVNPNASKLISIRKWPLARYAELVRRLLEDPSNVCVLTGVASERDDTAFIREAVPSERIIDLAGRTTLEELLLLFSIAELLITNDSGPAQFAALTNIDLLVFFGPETPKLYRPLTNRCTVMYADLACSPCVSAFNQRESVCVNNRCLTNISVDVAHAAATRILQRRALNR